MQWVAEQPTQSRLGADRRRDVEELVGTLGERLEVTSAEHLVAENGVVLEREDRLEHRIELIGLERSLEAADLLNERLREVQVELHGLSHQLLELLTRGSCQNEFEAGDMENVAFQQHHVVGNRSTIDIGAVGARQVANPQEAAHLMDLGVLLRDGVRGERQFQVRMSPDAEGEGMERNAAQNPALVDESLQVPDGLGPAVIALVDGFQSGHIRLTIRAGGWSHRRRGTSLAPWLSPSCDSAH